jgi:DNA-binding Xre family transcriptional regulator
MRGSDRLAWSTLRTLLAQKNLTVVDLHELLRARGFIVNKKSLYRLASSRPVQKLDTAIVRGICETLEVRLEELIQFDRPKLELFRLRPELRDELDKLIDKNNASKLTEEEELRLKTLLGEAQRVAITNVRILAEQTRASESGGPQVMVMGIDRCFGNKGERLGA